MQKRATPLRRAAPPSDDSLSISDVSSYNSDSDQRAGRGAGKPPTRKPAPAQPHPAQRQQGNSAFDALSSRPKTSTGLHHASKPPAGSSPAPRGGTTASHPEDQDLDDASISFDESMLGDSDDIVISGTQQAAAGRPPLAGGRQPAAAAPSAVIKVRPAPGLPPRALPPQRPAPGLPPRGPPPLQRRVSGDGGFSLSGSLDFSGDLEIEDVGQGTNGASNMGRGANGASNAGRGAGGGSSTARGTPGPSKGGPAAQPQQRALSSQPADRGRPHATGRVSGGSSFELSGDLSLSGEPGSTLAPLHTFRCTFPPHALLITGKHRLL